MIPQSNSSGKKMNVNKNQFLRVDVKTFSYCYECDSGWFGGYDHNVCLLGDFVTGSAKRGLIAFQNSQL